MVCAGDKGRGTARMCRIRFRRRRNPDLRIRRHGRVWKIFEWIVWIASDQMGMAQTITESARKWTRTVPASGSQFHKSRQQNLFVRRLGQRERWSEKQYPTIFERFVHSRNRWQSANLGFAHDLRRSAAATGITHRSSVHVQKDGEIEPSHLRWHEWLPFGRSLATRYGNDDVDAPNHKWANAVATFTAQLDTDRASNVRFRRMGSAGTWGRQNGTTWKGMEMHEHIGLSGFGYVFSILLDFQLRILTLFFRFLVFRENEMAGIDHGDKRRWFTTRSCWTLCGRHTYAALRMVGTWWLQEGLEQPG